MDSEFAERNTEFVRLDVAAIAFLLFLGSSISFITGRFGLGLNLATVMFTLVGLSVAYLWRKELIENNIVELNPLPGILTGGISILILQTFTGLIVFKYGLVASIIYGVIAALGYDVMVFILSLGFMPSDYKARRHPKAQYTNESDQTTYVFENETYINLVEKYAKQADPDNNHTNS